MALLEGTEAGLVDGTGTPLDRPADGTVSEHPPAPRGVCVLRVGDRFVAYVRGLLSDPTPITVDGHSRRVAVRRALDAASDHQAAS